MSEADPIRQNGEFHPDQVDPMLEAIRRAIIDAPQGAAALALFPALVEFTEKNVVIVPAGESDAGVDKLIERAAAAASGLCLLLIDGGATNPDPEAPGPRVALELECQMYLATRLWPKSKPSAKELVVGLARVLHHAQIRISGFPWHEEITFQGWEPLPDPDFLAYSISFTREMPL